MMKRITLVSTIVTIALICFFVLVISFEDCEGCYSAPVMIIRLMICGLVIIIGSIYFRTKYLKTESLILDIEDEPMRKTDETVEGVPFAGTGIIEGEGKKFLNSPYTNTPCVYFHSIKEKYIRRGKHSSWKVVENKANFIPFHIRDKRGTLKINLAAIDYDFSKHKIPFSYGNSKYLKHSEVDCDALLRKSVYKEKEKGLLGIQVSNKYRKSEFVLRPGIKVFVSGMILGEKGKLSLHESEDYPLIITQKSREQYVKDFYQGHNLVYLSHFLVAFGYTILIFSLNYFLKLHLSIFFITLLIGNLVILATIFVSLYNRIITLKQRALSALSNIKIDIKRKQDLIPNLVEVVKGYSKHEKEIQQIIAESSSKIVFSDEATEEKTPVIKSLIATIENYPKIRASEQFQFLMNRLVDTENRIAYSREFYNRSVRKYNTLISQFPFLLISYPLAMGLMKFISINNKEHGLPSSI
jgi:LemA protein